MAHIKTQGLIIKSTKFGESSRILTVLSREFGRIQVAANNVGRNKGGSTSSQMFAYSNFTLFKGQKSLYRLNDADCVEFFDDLRSDLEKLSYASYFADVVCNLTSENNQDDEKLLNLLLNSLHLLCKNAVAAKKIKLVFELCSISLAGFMPDFSCCHNCGTTINIAAFDLANSVIRCKNCIAIAPNIAEFNDTLRNACNYITTADMNKIFSFTLSDELLEYLGSIVERYVIFHMEKRLKSLDYLKKIL